MGVERHAGKGLRQDGPVNLRGEVACLRQGLDALTARVAALESLLPERHIAVLENEFVYDQPTVAMGPAPGRHALLPMVATVCFLLVFALILRTVTDNGLVPVRLGSLIGLGYALVLVVFGWLLYHRQSRIAPVFPMCGILLLFAVVIEVHSRFAMVPTIWAQLLLLQALLVVAAVGLRFAAPALLAVGVIGAGLAGLSLDFPNPMFPATGLLLLVGMLVAHWAAGRDISRSLRWVTLFMVMVFWLLWVIKLEAPLSRGQALTSELYAPWFFPMLLAFFALYLGIAIAQIRRGAAPLDLFASLLPVVNVGWVLAAGMSLAPGLWSFKLAGVTAIISTLIHLGLAAFFARERREGAPGVNALVVAGVVSLAMGLPFILGWVGWSLALWSAGSLALTLCAARWHSGGVRVTSYFLQLFTCGAAVASGALAIGAVAWYTAVPLATFLAGMALWQYRWCRAHVPTREGSAFFSWLDARDASAVALMVASLVVGFTGLRLVLHVGLERLAIESANSFSCGQTVLINVGAMVLLLIGWRRRSMEVVAVAIGIGVLGALKVFLYDLFTAKGLPLVFSVFSFGVLAAVGSAVSGRWHREQELASSRRDD